LKRRINAVFRNRWGSICRSRRRWRWRSPGCWTGFARAGEGATVAVADCEQMRWVADRLATAVKGKRLHPFNQWRYGWTVELPLAPSEALADVLETVAGGGNDQLSQRAPHEAARE
jgi:hypothetical protein